MSDYHDIKDVPCPQCNKCCWCEDNEEDGYMWECGHCGAALSTSSLLELKDER